MAIKRSHTPLRIRGVLRRNRYKEGNYSSSLFNNPIIFRRSCFKRTKLKIPHWYRHLHRVQKNVQLGILCVMCMLYRLWTSSSEEYRSSSYSFFFFVLAIPYLNFFLFSFLLRLVSNTRILGFSFLFHSRFLSFYRYISLFFSFSHPLFPFLPRPSLFLTLSPCFLSFVV